MTSACGLPFLSTGASGCRQGSHSLPTAHCVIARYHDIGRLVDEAGWYQTNWRRVGRALLSTASYFDALYSAPVIVKVFSSSSNLRFVTRKYCRRNCPASMTNTALGNGSAVKGVAITSCVPFTAGSPCFRRYRPCADHQCVTRNGTGSPIGCHSLQPGVISGYTPAINTP